MLQDTDGNSQTTRLLTLLNVSALKSKKRVVEPEDAPERRKKRRGIKFSDAESDLNTDTSPEATADTTIAPQNAVEDIVMAVEPDEAPEDEDQQDSSNPYERYFGANPAALTDASKLAADQREWHTVRQRIGSLYASVCSPREGGPITREHKGTISDRLMKTFETRQERQTSAKTQVQNDLLSILTSHHDLHYPCVPISENVIAREAIMLHALDHVTRKRRRIIRNNERIAHAKAASISPPEDVQDQGFTRPSALVLLPFRSSAMNWFNALKSHTMSPSFQVENQSRFMSEYGLPPGAVDKLESAGPGAYPEDHVETFKGNVDDNFRLGIKLTRKSVKLFADFYGCDIIFASPLGLRMSIEKEKSADFLSSIEVLVIDQMNALAMQNWDHVQFVMSNINKLPKDSHDADFSRIKPWYLDQNSIYLRQTVMLSAFETPEMRQLFNTSLKNVTGKVRVEKTWPAVQVPASVDKLFVSFDCSSPREEPDKRFNYFTTQLLPKILKSAVQSTNTVLFIPSSFDFIRVHNYFRKNSPVSFAVLSEYSSNQDISRARQGFFSGKKSFLLISERFHFYRRYKIRGIRNIIFYAPPDNAQFFSELLSYPFLDDGVDASDVSCRMLYCQYDRLRMERILGSKGVKSLI
ncbi:DUF1253-domain-containing protein [Coniophora puteana RWD-64-598 SS2]|uniref:U3 small nucleolar RNA-associated protein 25 n=1 Tax=Coniophora puteana (strain RWD-64-598) TaxID=741705 RepID=A0A5M3MUP0_CONPW|nr:DUF1253-domain-containing protein [Coniophora puteana RWD-64-598 SS2]EIW82849.1 DUF1253-domain-containing protein [Coniophora puteana RWD-64-598 SS2]